MAHELTVISTRKGKPKASATHVRTGCVTCKIRRVKCDEGKPYCNRCERAGRKCDGYLPPKSTVLRILPASLVGNEQERRSFHFFIDRTAVELSGYFDSAFWSRLVLQASHTEPAIRHTVIALGSLHESFETGESKSLTTAEADAHRIFSLQEYNKAVQSLIQHGNLSSPEVTLIACILFVCFENFHGNYQAALEHLQAGLNILHEHGLSVLRVSRPDDDSIIEKDLLGLFARLDVQATTFLDTRTLETHLGVEHTNAAEVDVPSSFSNLAEAKASLDCQLNWMFHSLELHLRLESDIVPPLERVQLRLQRWSTAFDAFLRQKTYQMETRDLKGSMVLKILSKVAHVMLHTLPSPFETSFDAHEKTFQEVVSLAQSVVDASAKPGFTFDIGIVAPLYWTASRCRNPSIRRQAIAILYSSPRIEGVWESGRVAKFAEKLVEIEEQGLGIISSSDQVPESARIRVAAADFYPDQRMVSFKYTHYPYDETMLKEMWLSWTAAPTPRAGIYPRLGRATVLGQKYLADTEQGPGFDLTWSTRSMRRIV